MGTIGIICTIIGTVITILSGVWWIFSHVFKLGQFKEHFENFERNTETNFNKLEKGFNDVDMKFNCIEKKLEGISDTVSSHTYTLISICSFLDNKFPKNKINSYMKKSPRQLTTFGEKMLDMVNGRQFLNDNKEQLNNRQVSS